MPLFIAALLGGLIQAAGSLVGRVLIALGVGYVSYSGVSVLLTALKTQAIQNLTGLPSVAVQVLSILKIDVCLNITFSALAARLILKGLTSDKITRMVLK